MEHEAEFKAWRIDDVYYSQNNAARLAQIPEYFCPTRRTPDMNPQASISGDQNDEGGGLGPQVPGALGDYGASVGTDGCDGADCDGKIYNGAFRTEVNQYNMPLRPITFAQITDGVSNTIFIGEKHVQFGNFGRGKLDCSIYNGDYPICWSRGAGPSYKLAQTPQDATEGFGSYHPSLCQFLFGDGSVRAINNNVDGNTMALLVNIADGHPPPEY
jgi:prepilin-type processing-associated H-X9-DG protein